MKKGAVIAVVVAVVVVLACIGLATADSCKRLNRPCFGNSQQR